MRYTAAGPPQRGDGPLECVKQSKFSRRVGSSAYTLRKVGVCNWNQVPGNEYQTRHPGCFCRRTNRATQGSGCLGVLRRSRRRPRSGRGTRSKTPRQPEPRASVGLSPQRVNHPVQLVFFAGTPNPQGGDLVARVLGLVAMGPVMGLASKHRAALVGKEFSNVDRLLVTE